MPAKKPINQNIKLHGIPASQQKARAARAAAAHKPGHPPPPPRSNRSQKVKTNYRPMTRAQQEARERSPVHKAKEALGGFIGRGLENFARNQEEQERSERKGRPSNRPAAPAWGMDHIRDHGINLDAFNMGGRGMNIDLCQHPDPMVSGLCGPERDRDRKPVRKVVTRTEYR